MDALTALVNTQTPNIALSGIQSNFEIIEAAIEVNEGVITGAEGVLVGTTASQTLTNKTMVSAGRGGTNLLDIGRKDLGDDSLFNVLTYRNGLGNNSITNIKVDDDTIYNLTISGGNGVKASATNNWLHLDLETDAVLSSASQTWVQGASAITTGFATDFAGNVRARTKLALGYHTVAPTSDFHFKPQSMLNDFSGIYEVASGQNISEQYTVNTNTLQTVWDGTTWLQSLNGSVMQTLVAAGLTISGTLDVSGDINATGAGTYKGTIDATATLGADLVGTSQIKDDAVTNAKMANLAIDTAELAATSVTTAKIGNLAVTTGKLASASVTEAKIGTGAVVEAKLATDAVTTDKVASSVFGNSMQLAGGNWDVKPGNATISVNASGVQLGDVTITNLSTNIIDDTISGVNNIWTASKTGAVIEESAGYFGDKTRIKLSTIAFEKGYSHTDTGVRGSPYDYYRLETLGYTYAYIPLPIGFKTTGACLWASNTLVKWKVHECSVKNEDRTSLSSTWTDSVSADSSESITPYNISDSTVMVAGGFKYVIFEVYNTGPTVHNFYGATIEIEKA